MVSKTAVRAIGLLSAMMMLMMPLGAQAQAPAPNGDLQATSVQPAMAQACAAGSLLIRVPGECSSLQTAINLVGNGGVIEMAAGTYPVSGSSIRINDPQKSFTLRGIGGVTLTGGDAGDILQITNSDINRGGTIAIDNIVFANGRSGQDGVGGAVTIMRARVVFSNCRFENNNGAQPSTGGGAMLVGLGSSVQISSCTFQNNSARNEGGALAIGSGASVGIAGSTFSSNRVNLPGHRNTAAGGAIHVGNANLSVNGSLFQDNRAGYVAGAIYAIGSWSGDPNTPQSNISIGNSRFINNAAQRDGSVPPPAPSEGGAVHIEDQTRLLLSHSEFRGNFAEIGGAVTNYRAVLEVSNSLFADNKATGNGGGTGFGGAIAATSNDTPGDGGNNRRPASVNVQDSLFTASSPVGQTAGAIYIAGDANRQYGQNGVGQQGSPNENRAKLNLSNSIIFDVDVQENSAPGSGVGGGIVADLASVTTDNVLLAKSDALGTNNGSGGAVALINQSDGLLRNTMIAGNSAGRFGGGLFVQGSNVLVQGSTFSDNDVVPGTSEPLNSSFGSSMFSGLDDGRGLPVTGRVEQSIISSNFGLLVFDDDRVRGPINDVRYNDNTFWGAAFNNVIYANSLAPNKNVAELNNLTITRNGQPSTEKSQQDNRAASSEPAAAKIVAIPALVIQGSPVPACIAYAWQGGRATLNGQVVNERIALKCDVKPGTFTLTVGNVSVSDSIAQAQPRAFLPLILR